jgi:hypothetical protein
MKESRYVHPRIRVDQRDDQVAAVSSNDMEVSLSG